jgi:tight adherence protein B
MSFLFGNEIIVVVLFAVVVFFIVYLNLDRIYDKSKAQILTQRDLIIKYLDLMFVEIQVQRITILVLLLSAGLATAVFLFFLPNWIAGLLFGGLFYVAGLRLPPLIVKNMYEKRSGKFVEQMVDGLTIMANGIKSGLTVPQAMERVVDNLPPPISQEFSLVLSQLRLGRSLEEALIELAERIPQQDVQMFVTGINILKETGGNLAETFETIVLTIRERQKIEKKIQAMTAQGLMQGIIVTLVPFGLIGLFMVVDPGYMKPMFNSTLGLFILFLMLVLQIIGGLVIRKIVKIKV